jgi:hypothetical protein
MQHAASMTLILLPPGRMTAIPSPTRISACTWPLAGPGHGWGKVADQPTITGSRCVQSLRSVSFDSLSFRGPGLFVICDEAPRVTLRFLSIPIPPTTIRAIPVGTPNQSPKGCASTAPCRPVFCPCTTSIWMAFLWRSLSGSSR